MLALLETVSPSTGYPYHTAEIPDTLAIASPVSTAGPVAKPPCRSVESESGLLPRDGQLIALLSTFGALLLLLNQPRARQDQNCVSRHETIEHF